MYAETADGLLHSTFLKLCLLGANSFFKQRLFFYDFVLCQDLSLVLYYDFWTGPDRLVFFNSICFAWNTSRVFMENIHIACLDFIRSSIWGLLVCLTNTWPKSNQSDFLARNNDAPPDPRPVIGQSGNTVAYKSTYDETLGDAAISGLRCVWRFWGLKRKQQQQRRRRRRR